jgi:selenoprotein W-related protein
MLSDFDPSIIPAENSSIGVATGTNMTHAAAGAPSSDSSTTPISKPLVELEYCPKCRWLLRSSWMAQELLTTFEAELGGVSLMPSEVSGAFEVRVGGQTVWSRATQGRFPDIKELKKVVRDVAAPDKNLGHSDR